MKEKEKQHTRKICLCYFMSLFYSMSYTTGYGPANKYLLVCASFQLIYKLD